LKATKVYRFLKSITYSPNGSRIASNLANDLVGFRRQYSIIIWDVQTSDVVSRIFSAEVITSNIMYSPDGTQVVSGCHQLSKTCHTIKFQDAETGDVVGKPLSGHTGEISHIAFSSDESRIISGSGDKTIRIWDAKTAPFYNLQVGLNTDFDVVMDKDGWIYRQDGAQFTDEDEEQINQEEQSNEEEWIDEEEWSDEEEQSDEFGPLEFSRRRLLWIPEDCRSGLESAALITISATGHYRRVRLDISQMSHGPSWTDIFVSSSAK
jgi:hypothetical protein